MADAGGGEVKRQRRNRFVPVEEAPTGELSARARELIALAVIGFCLYGLLCLATFRKMAPGGVDIPTGSLHNLGGRFGYYLAQGFTFVFGFAAWLPFLFTLGYSVLLFAGRKLDRPIVKVIGSLVFTAMVAVWLAGADGGAGGGELTPWGAGGRLGVNLSPKLQGTFGGPGRLLLLGFGALVSFLLVTEWLFSALLERTVRRGEVLWRRLWRLPAVATADGEAGAALLDDDEPATPERKRRAPRTPKPAVTAAEPAGANASRVAPVDDDDEEDDEDEDEALRQPSAKDGRAKDGRAKDALAEDVDDEVSAKARPTAAEKAPELAPPAPVQAKPVLHVNKPKPKPKPKPRSRRPGQGDLPFDDDYPFPPLELFKEPQPGDTDATSQVLEQNSAAITAKLRSFGVGANVVGVSVGPAVTQYELRLDEGIRVGKLVGFEADLSAALRAVSVRVVAPIPGKDTIGIEVPNQKRQTVVMRELLELHGREEDLAIPLYLGKDVAGAPIVEDLARMPHLLIAGTTGSGKSVCINTILLSILMTRTPSQVRLILLDPKQVELQAYKMVPHLCCDVVTNMKKAPSVLQWAVDEMENRYSMLSGAGVNHIKNYNRLGQQELEKRLKRELEPDRVRLPYIVIVIDELADLMSVAAKEVEESIQRLAQKSRAVGMHVILATQRPSTEVITGIIKANLPCQIAFKVNRKIDSRVILDANGAEKLLGFGDMLYVPPGGGQLTRAQGTFVADEELLGVVRYLQEQGQQPDFLPELVQTQTARHKSMADRDEMFAQAVEVVLGQQRGSATLLQRALGVGYTRATRLLEMMEEEGLVGPFVGSKSREVLMDLEQYKQHQAEVARALEYAAEDAAAAAEADEVGDGVDPGEADGLVEADELPEPQVEAD